EFGHRVLARSHGQPCPALAPRERACRDRREQSRLEDGGLAGAGRPDEADERGADQARDDVRDDAFPSEEVLSVIGLERREALEGAGNDDLLRLSLGPWCQIERRVLLEDRALELLERSARLEAELLAQQLPRVAIDRH